MTFLAYKTNCMQAYGKDLEFTRQGYIYVVDWNCKWFGFTFSFNKWDNK